MVHSTVQDRNTRVVFKLNVTNVATVSRRRFLLLVSTAQYCLCYAVLILIRFKSVREQVDVGAAADAAKDPTLSSLDVPFLRFKLILVHPLDAIEAKHEHKEEDGFQENAIGNVRVSKHDVYVDDVDEGVAAWVLNALFNTVLVHNKGAPNAESE